MVITGFPYRDVQVDQTRQYGFGNSDTKRKESIIQCITHQTTAPASNVSN